MAVTITPASLDMGSLLSSKFKYTKQITITTTSDIIISYIESNNPSISIEKNYSRNGRKVPYTLLSGQSLVVDVFVENISIRKTENNIAGSIVVCYD
jgi:hypothetical protein